MKKINRFLYKVEYAIKRMNPAHRRIYIVLVIFSLLSSHIGWEVWQSYRFQQELQMIEQMNLDLRKKINALEER